MCECYVTTFTTDVITVQYATKDIVMAENLDKKIEEALANEVLEDFIISPTSGEKKTITFRNL